MPHAAEPAAAGTLVEDIEFFANPSATELVTDH